MAADLPPFLLLRLSVFRASWVRMRRVKRDNAWNDRHFAGGQQGSARDVADAALFLASDEAGFITGGDLAR